MFDGDSQLWVHLRGLPTSLTEGDLVCILSQFGEILELCLSQQDEDRKSTGSCFIKYESSKNCDRAVHYLHGTTLLGNELDVTYADKFCTKRKRTPQLENGETTKINGYPTSRDSKQLNGDDLITHIRDSIIIKPNCLSGRVNLKTAQEKPPLRSETPLEKTSDRKDEHYSSSTKHFHAGSSYSTKDSEPRLRDLHSPTRSSRSRYRSSGEHERESSLRSRDTYSPYSGHYINSSTVYRYSETNTASRRKSSHQISPDRLSVNLTRNSSSPRRRRILSPSSPTGRRYRNHRESSSPRRRHYYSRPSPCRGYETYQRYEYVRVSSPRYSRYFHQYNERSSSSHSRRSTSRYCSRSPRRERSRSPRRGRSRSPRRERSKSPRRERSKSRHRSSSRHRDSSSRNRSPSIRSPSTDRLYRVSSTSHLRSRSCQRALSPKELRSYYRREAVDHEKSRDRDRCKPDSENRNGGVGATGISLILERRLTRHYESNGI